MTREVDDFQAQRHTRGRGATAEDAAVRWLEERGYRPIERNAVNKAGEIDLVALEGGDLCFVEIKARTDATYGPAIEAVTPHKQRRLSRAAALHLAQSDWRGPCRFDVLGLDQEDGEWRYTLIRDAFPVATER